MDSEAPAITPDRPPPGGNSSAGLKPDVPQLLLVVLIAGAVALLYSRYGSDSDTASTSHSIFRWLSIQWRHENFRNNWVMLLVSAFVAYQRRHAILAARKTPSWSGLGVVLASLSLHVIGYRTQQPRLSLMSVVGVSWGTCHALWGWPVARELLFPAGYALLCFSSSLLLDFTMPLRLIASRFAEFLLQGVGIEVIRKGTVILSGAGGGFQLDVADACSGLRSLVVMTALAAPYAYFTLQRNLARWVLFLLSVPLAMIANTLRIFTLALVAEWIGMRLAMALYHDFSGYLVFFIALGLLTGTGRILSLDWRATWRAWRQNGFCRT